MNKIKIIQGIENPLFERKEILVEMESDSNITHADAEKAISKEFSSDINNIKIKKIKGNFGENIFKISANIYKNQETKEKIEPKQKSREKK